MKIKDLPKSKNSRKSDLLTIVQSGVTKTITKQELVKDLEASIKRISNQVSQVTNQISRDVIQRGNASFESPVRGKDPVNSSHLATKGYVDRNLINTVKNDGTTRLVNPLAYRTSPGDFQDNELVDKNFVDNQLKSVLKKVSKMKGSSGYPNSVAGDTFFIEERQEVFATNGPEVQKGDLLICIEDSDGGTHGEVGHQFAIVNTNVVYATEDTPGILRAATKEEAQALKATDSALTPEAYRIALETGSEYNRTAFAVSTVNLTEEDRGIIGLDTRRSTVTVNLPIIGRLENAKVVKYTIKDEHNNSVKNPITVVCSGGNKIQGSRTYLINTDGAAIKLYNDGSNEWFLENNVTGAVVSQGVKNLVTDETTVGESPLTAGSADAVMSVDIDLREYPIGSGFKIVGHAFAAGNGNTKTTAIGVDFDNNATQIVASSITTVTAPNAKFIQHEVTVLHSDTPKTLAFGVVTVGTDSAAGLTNNLDLNWDQKVKVSFIANVNPVTDIKVYALQVIPLK